MLPSSLKVLDDRDPLNKVRDDDYLVAFEMVRVREIEGAQLAMSHSLSSLDQITDWIYSSKSNKCPPCTLAIHTADYRLEWDGEALPHTS